jgi:hypothetical protein
VATGREAEHPVFGDQSFVGPEIVEVEVFVWVVQLQLELVTDSRGAGSCPLRR